MKVKKPFFIAMLVWLVLLIGDTVVEMQGMGQASTSDAFGMIGNALSTGGDLKTFMMGLKVNIEGSMGLTAQFFIILIIFAGIGLFLSNRKPTVTPQ